LATLLKAGFFLPNTNSGEPPLREIIQRYMSKNNISLMLTPKADTEPLNFFNQLRSIRRGSKLSRFFRCMFEHKHVKRILGTNLTFLMAVSAFIPKSIDQNIEPETAIINTQIAKNFKTEKSVSYPVDKVVINQGYYFFHPGLDFEGITGEPVRAILKGVVNNIQYSRYAYGNAVLIDHGSGLESLYAHLSTISVEVGQKIEAGEKIGEIGSTGRSTGDHLHLETRQNGRPFNPFTILPSLNQQ